MDCEICHKAPASAAIVREGGDPNDEIYVCAECAKAERLKRQKKSQRTRKVAGLPPGVSMSITEIGGGEGDDAPPFIGAIMNAFQDMVSDIEQISGKESAPKVESREKYHDFPVARVDKAFRIGNRLHLEGLNLIGEMDAVKRAMRALKLELVGVSVDGVNDAGHVYSLRYAGSIELAKRVVEDLLREERNARVRLFEEMPRIYGDALCRALAVLKNCRMLSPGELFDMLSPLRLAVAEDMLDGITREEIETMLLGADLTGGEDKLVPEERDRVDAERADEINRRFEDVVLNERAEEKFL